MDILLNLLEQYVNEECLPGLLNTSGYYAAGMQLAQHWEAFRATLTKEQVETLEAVQDEEAIVRRMEDQAAFRAALSMGIQLSRL